MKSYDVVIIGSGPAGLSAAVYASRSGVSVCVIEEYALGGLLAAISTIHNYPGYVDISGYELAQAMYVQAVKFGAEVVFGKAEKIEKGTPNRVTVNGEIYEGDALVLAMGNTPRKLGVPREDELIGRGVSYCATCDGNFFKGKTVAVAGVSSYAYEAVEYLTGLASKVYQISQTDIKQKTKAYRLSNAEIVELVGTPLSEIRYRQDGEVKSVKADGLFVELGYMPSTALVKDTVLTDERGFIITDERMATDCDGIFAAGDVRKTPLKQVVTACADGAIAGTYAAAYAKKVNKRVK